MANVSVFVGNDGTVGVRVGRYVEIFDARGKTNFELVDCVRWSLITAGVSMNEREVKTLIERAREAG